MEAIIKSEDGGETRTYVGVTVCRGPGQVRLVLTRPYHEAGRVVEIPKSSVESLEPAPHVDLGEDPTLSG
jgi:hypothetical protein